METIFENITILVEYLKREHSNEYSYRGQNHHYGKILPSYYRNIIESTPIIYENQKFWNVKKDVKSDTLVKTMQHVRTKLIKATGLGLGNIIAQQYGLNSETLDVTNSPEIAAFFATREYPYYSHFSMQKNKEYGVIYRFPITHQFKLVSRLENFLSSAGMKEKGSTIWFENLHTEEQINKSEFIRYFGKYGPERAELFTPTTHLSHHELLDFLMSLKFKGKEISEEICRNTRTIRQEGGFIRPPIIHECVIPKKRTIEYKSHLMDRNYFHQQSALMKNTKSIADLVDYPGLEVFYFKHTSEKVNLNKEYLWPKKNEDYIFNFLLKEFIDDTVKKYIEDTNISIDNNSIGIFKKGYDD